MKQTLRLACQDQGTGPVAQPAASTEGSSFTIAASSAIQGPSRQARVRFHKASK